STVFAFQLDPTTYSFTLAAPLYEETTLGPIPYAPGEHPLEKSYTLTQQFVTVSGKVSVSSTGRKSTHPIHALPLTLTSSTGKTYTTATTSKGTYTFPSKVPVGDYTITVGDTYTTIAPISFSTGTTNRFVENFAVYAPPIPLKVQITNTVAAASANGVRVTLTPPSNAAVVTKACGAHDTHELLEEGLGSTETATTVGTATQAVASFTDLVPDVYTVTFSGIGTKTDLPTPRSHTLVVCPSSASSPATTQTPTTPPEFTLGVGEVSVTVTLQTVPAVPPVVKMAAGSLKTACTPVAGSSTTASCNLHLLVDLTQTYKVTISALGYTTPPSENVTLTPAGPTRTLTAEELEPNGVAGVRVTLTATGHDAVAAAVATASATLKGAHTYSTKANSSGVATFSAPVKPGSYKLVLTPTLSGASSKQTEGTIKIKSTTKNYTVKVATHSVSGTVTLEVTPAPPSPVTVHVKVDAVGCGTVTITGKKTGTYTCVVPPGAYTLTFSATGYTSSSVAATVKGSNATGKDVSLQPAPVPSVKVTLTATGHATAAAAIATATVTLTGGHTYHEAATSGGVATFSTVRPGTYTVSFVPKLSGASSPQTEGSVTISSAATTFTKKVKTGTVGGTITLGGTAPTSTVTVTVSIGSVDCTTATVAKTTSTATYTCVLPAGTYTLTFGATGYKTVAQSAVAVTATHGATAAATLTPTP
ncbi:MAG TPA: carboxypeptidase regulatory-like domain-containing protein, partial [Acidimicrobiales bacterium]|nr:carboxypeptidase regulatory-like domain-containing protein [Acidimicrobiales bacterium]